MKKIVFLVAALFSLTAPAMALDNLNGFKLPGSTITPNNMLCSTFLEHEKPMQMFISAWFDGFSSTFKSFTSVEYMEDDVRSMFKELVRGCKETPEETLGDVRFDYGGDGPSNKPTCELLASQPNAEKASHLLVWVMGFVADDSGGDESVNIKGFTAWANDIFKQCENQPQANLIELVMVNQGLLDADDMQSVGDSRSSDSSDSSSSRGSKDIDN